MHLELEASTHKCRVEELLAGQQVMWKYPMDIDREINRGQQCDIAMSKANVVLCCGLTTTGTLFLIPSFGYNC